MDDLSYMVWVVKQLQCQNQLLFPVILSKPVLPLIDSCTYKVARHPGQVNFFIYDRDHDIQYMVKTDSLPGIKDFPDYVKYPNN